FSAPLGPKRKSFTVGSSWLMTAGDQFPSVRMESFTLGHWRSRRKGRRSALGERAAICRPGLLAARRKQGASRGCLAKKSLEVRTDFQALFASYTAVAGRWTP